MQLELDFYDRGDHVRHVQRLPRAPWESPFATLDEMWHATRPAEVLYSSKDAAAEQIESGFAHFTQGPQRVDRRWCLANAHVRRHIVGQQGLNFA